MDHYLEITLLPDPEFKSTVLMNALFAKLHRALCDLHSTGIGISFPGADPQRSVLGERLRLHGTFETLQSLMALPWLAGMRDHTVVEKPAPVPRAVTHRVVRRVQVKSNPERLRRRLARRKGLSEDDARRILPQEVGERSQLPYVTVKSRSTGQEFRVFIEQMPPVEQSAIGTFSLYGLSPVATVPWF
jgi:CRISPR-associated endonuclease Csy4